jgi:hypothetical protein
MKRSRVSVNVNVKKRRPGRPATGVDPAVAVRLPRDVLAAVTQWAVDNETTRSEAIRELIERGLGSKGEAAKPPRPVKKDNT